MTNEQIERVFGWLHELGIIVRDFNIVAVVTASAGMPSSWLTIWAHVVSWPWPWPRAPVRTMALPVMSPPRMRTSTS